MLKIFLLSILQLYMFYGSDPVFGQNIPQYISPEFEQTFAAAESFDDLFQLSASIPLSDSIPIGNRYSLDVSSQGRFLINDHRDVLLFNSDGELLRKLDASQIHPGVRWQPTRARFTDNGQI